MRRKKTADYRALATACDFTWLGESLPVDTHTKTSWQCAQKHVWAATYSRIQQGNGCPHCAGVVKKTKDDYRALAAACGFTWIGRKLPTNTHTKTGWQCIQKHVWAATYESIQKGRGCPHCAGVAKKTEADYRVLAATCGFTWIGESLPADTEIKTTWQCEHNHRWNATYASIRQGSGCPHCYGNAPRTKDDYRIVGASQNIIWTGRVLPTNTHTKTSWRCEHTHRWKTSYGVIRQGNGCPYCYGDVPRTEEDYFSVGAERSIVWIGEYLPDNIQTSTIWWCARRHVFNATYANIQQGRNCPQCGRRTRRRSN